ncbi:MAG: Do family serine endopeptidase [Gemmobacter sp.]|jgi:serine protease Do|nr:Do family serine endopeptidase [Gemmobacter sp.]
MQSQVQVLPTPQAMRALWLGFLALVFAVAQAVAVQARGVPESFADLAERISPSVVNITTSTVVAQATDRRPQLPEGSPFEELFRDFMDRNNRGGGPERAPRRGQALGSGFVISEDGVIVTNNHVIEGADDIEIEFFSGNRLKAKVIGTDPKTDLAVLKVESSTPLPFVQFGDSSAMRVGDWVMAMGNPLGQGFSVSAGIVSARGRSLQGTYDDYLQTDAAINRGNSGGPLFNMNGEVIGVNTAILSPNGGSIGIGFAMASNVVTKVVAQLRDFGETRRGWLGVRIQDVTPDIAEAMGLEKAAGAMVTDVPEGPARDAGMQANDVIVSFDGQDVRDTRELVRRVADADVGKAVRVVVLRDGKTTTLSVTLGRRETAENEARPAVAGQAPAAPVEETLLGMTLRVPTEDERQAAGLPAGAPGLLVVGVQAGSEADAKGLAEGDVITEAGQQTVTTPADLTKRIAEARDAGRRSLLLLVRRGGDPRFVALAVN